ncbi:finger 233-like [Octopus vulgaris]|nr:finger 233-like [Octopus vulgaris]
MIMDNVEPTREDEKIVMISSESASTPEPEKRILQNRYNSGVVRTARLSKKLFHCDTCGKDFSRKEYLQMHQRNHLPENPFMCKICGREFNRNFPLQKHQQTHENAKKQREKYKDNRFKCEICDEKFPDHSSLMGHYSRKHSNGNDDGKGKWESVPDFPCHICGKSYKKETSLKRHVPIHKKKPFHCDLCKRNFVLDKQLQEHKAKHRINKD